MAEYTKFQQKAIKNYYDNREGIAMQRVQELCTELYLAEGKKLEQHWKTLVTHLEALKVPKKQIDHLVKQFHQLAAQLRRLFQKHPFQPERVAPDQSANTGWSATDNRDVTRLRH